MRIKQRVQRAYHQMRRTHAENERRQKGERPNYHAMSNEELNALLMLTDLDLTIRGIEHPEPPYLPPTKKRTCNKQKKQR